MPAFVDEVLNSWGLGIRGEWGPRLGRVRGSSCGHNVRSERNEESDDESDNSTGSLDVDPKDPNDPNHQRRQQFLRARQGHEYEIARRLEEIENALFLEWPPGAAAAAGDATAARLGDGTSTKGGFVDESVYSMASEDPWFP